MPIEKMVMRRVIRRLKKEVKIQKNRLIRAEGEKERQRLIMDDLEAKMKAANAEISCLKAECNEQKVRAERAEQFWSERQNEVAELSCALQRERGRLSQKDTDAFAQFYRLLKLMRGQLLRKFGMTLTVKLGRSDDMYCLDEGLALTFLPEMIVNLFCELLGISEKNFWENINLGWKMCLQSRLDKGCGVARKDNFSEFPGRRLRADAPCLMDKRGEGGLK